MEPLVWTNRNGTPRKYIRQDKESEKVTGWTLADDNGTVIARAGKSELPNIATDWRHTDGDDSDDALYVVVREYKGL